MPTVADNVETTWSSGISPALFDIILSTMIASCLESSGVSAAMRQRSAEIMEIPRMINVT
jgi:hypothetical protein